MNAFVFSSAPRKNAPWDQGLYLEFLLFIIITITPV